MRMYYHRPPRTCSLDMISKLKAKELQMTPQPLERELLDKRSNLSNLYCSEQDMFHLGSWCVRPVNDHGHPFAPKQFFKTSHVISHMIHYLGAHTAGKEIELDHVKEARLNHYKLADGHECTEKLTRDCFSYFEPPPCDENMMIDETSVNKFLPELK